MTTIPSTRRATPPGSSTSTTRLRSSTRTERIGEQGTGVVLAQPIPHLAVGNSLVIGTNELGVCGWSPFVVRRIETGIFLRQPPEGVIFLSTVYIEKCERGRVPVR